MPMAAARILSLARRLRRCERGFVLPLTLGISTVLAIVGTTTSPVRRTLGVNVGVDPSYSQPLNNMAWNYIWAKATGSACDMTIGQSVNVATPLYVEGNLCLQNTATISSGPLVVRGSLTM